MSRLRNWFQAQSARGQWAAGCAGVIFVVTLCLYGLGLASYMARPGLIAKPPAATMVLAVPTNIQAPTFAPPTVPPTFVLPGSTLVATPTQAPIPTRAPPTETPTPTLAPNAVPGAFTNTPDATLYFELSQTRQP